MNILRSIVFRLLVSVIGVGQVQAVTLEISLRSTFNGDPLLLDSLRYPNSAGETISFTRLSYLVSGFALEGEDGVWIELSDRYAWIDAAKRRTTFQLDDVPAGKYRALRFQLGPDAAANTADPAKLAADHPLNPNLNSLHWSWQGGYIFLAVEGHYRTGSSELKGYAYHLARDPNRTRISLAAPLDLTHNSAALIDFDIGTLLNAPRPLAFGRDGAATHSREGDPIAAALVANLPGAFRVTRILSDSPEIRRPTPLRPIDLPAKFTPYRFTTPISPPSGPSQWLFQGPPAESKILAAPMKARTFSPAA